MDDLLVCPQFAPARLAKVAARGFAAEQHQR